MSLDLRPLTLGELLDRAFSLYRSHFRTFVAIMAGPAVLGAGFGLFVELVRGSELFVRTGPPADRAMMVLGVAALFCVFMLAYFALYTVAIGATTAALSNLYMGRPATAAGAYSQVRNRTGPLLLVLILTTFRLIAIAAVIAPIVMIFAGIAVTLQRSGSTGAAVAAAVLGLALFLCAAVLVVWMMLRYSLAVPAVVIESLTAREGIRRSIALMSGNLGRALVLMVFGFVIAQIVALIIQGPFAVAAGLAGPDSPAVLWLKLAGAAAGSLGSAISAPLMSVALALLYYDARVRHEGFDLQVMMDMLDDGTAALASPHRSAAL